MLAKELKRFVTMKNFFNLHESIERKENDVINIEKILFGLKRKQCIQAKIS